MDTTVPCGCPFHQRAAHAARLCTGSTALRRRASAWILPEGRTTAARWRLTGTIASALLLDLEPWLMWPLTGVWCVAAWRAGDDGPQAPQEPVEEQQEGTSTDGIRALLVECTGDRNGVHLVTLLARLQEEGHHTRLTVTHLRARLDALGIPVRRSLKVGGAVRMGVHRDDFPAPSPAGRPPGTQPAGEPDDLRQRPSSTG